MTNRRLRCVEEVSECWIFRQLGWYEAFLAGVLTVLMARSVEIAAPMVVLSTMWRTEVPTMTLNGKFWFDYSKISNPVWRLDEVDLRDPAVLVHDGLIHD